MTFKLADIIGQSSRDLLQNLREKQAGEQKVEAREKDTEALKNFDLCKKHNKFYKKEAGCPLCRELEKK